MNSWLIVLGFLASAVLGGDIAGKICNTLVERKRLETRDRTTRVEMVVVIPQLDQIEDEFSALQEDELFNSLFSELWDDDNEPITPNPPQGENKNDTAPAAQCTVDNSDDNWKCPY